MNQSFSWQGVLVWSNKSILSKGHQEHQQNPTETNGECLHLRAINTKKACHLTWQTLHTPVNEPPLWPVCVCTYTASCSSRKHGRAGWAELGGAVHNYSSGLIVCSNTYWPNICWKFRLCLQLPEEVAETLLQEIIPISSFVYDLKHLYN